MYRVLKSKFGFNQFRHRQKHAIIAALLGYDCFILMPTGLLTFLFPFALPVKSFCFALELHFRSWKKSLLSASSCFVKGCHNCYLPSEVANRRPKNENERA